MAKESIKNNEETVKVQTQNQYKPYVFVRLKKDKEWVRPVVYSYGSDPDSVRKTAVETFIRVRNELIQKGRRVPPVNGSNENSNTHKRRVANK